jgi:hypothetical protein
MRNVMAQSAGLVSLLGVVISIIIVKSKDYEREIIKYQEQVNRFVVVLDKKELLSPVIQWQRK